MSVSTTISASKQQLLIKIRMLNFFSISVISQELSGKFTTIITVNCIYAVFN